MLEAIIGFCVGAIPTLLFALWMAGKSYENGYKTGFLVGKGKQDV